MKRTWTKEQLDILDTEYPLANLSDLAVKLNKTKEAVKAKALLRNLRRSPEVRLWNPQRKQKLIQLYADNTNKEIAELIGVSESAVSAKAFMLKLRKSESFMVEHSSKGYFKKGSSPPNKGKKMSAYMYERCKATMFKKGDLPSNYKPVGYERVNVDGYIEVKVADPNVFKLKHRVEWEKVNGAIPEGYNLKFKDGNRLNTSPDNMMLISKQDNMNANTIHRYSPELKNAIRNIGKLNRTINNYGKN